MCKYMTCDINRTTEFYWHPYSTPCLSITRVAGCYFAAHVAHTVSDLRKQYLLAGKSFVIFLLALAPTRDQNTPSQRQI